MSDVDDVRVFDELRDLLDKRRAEIPIDQKPESSADYFRRVGENAAARARSLGLVGDGMAATEPRDPLEDAIVDLPKRYTFGATFGNPDFLRKAVRSPVAIDRGGAHRMDPKLVFTGGSGTGKTTLAVACLRARWLDGTALNRPRGRFISCWRLGIARANSRLGEEPAMVEVALNWRGVLLLDDLGNPNRDAPSTPIPDVILARHDAELPTWITTWMNAAEVETRYGAGVARRVFEGADIIDCGAKT